MAESDSRIDTLFSQPLNRRLFNKGVITGVKVIGAMGAVELLTNVIEACSSQTETELKDNEPKGIESQYLNEIINNHPNRENESNKVFASLNTDQKNTSLINYQTNRVSPSLQNNFAQQISDTTKTNFHKDLGYAYMNLANLYWLGDIQQPTPAMSQNTLLGAFSNTASKLSLHAESAQGPDLGAILLARTHMIAATNAHNFYTGDTEVFRQYDLSENLIQKIVAGSIDITSGDLHKAVNEITDYLKQNTQTVQKKNAAVVDAAPYMLIGWALPSTDQTLPGGSFLTNKQKAFQNTEDLKMQVFEQYNRLTPSEKIKVNKDFYSSLLIRLFYSTLYEKNGEAAYLLTDDNDNYANLIVNP